MHLHINTKTDRKDFESLYSNKFVKFITFIKLLMVILFPIRIDYITLNL